MTTLTYVERREMLSIYRRPDGSLVRLAPRTFLVEYDYDDVLQMWADIPRRERDFEAFIEKLRTILTEPDLADEMQSCNYCGRVDHEDFGSTVEGDDEWACDSCVSNYYYGCASCDGLYRETHTTLHGDYVCIGCEEEYYSYCEDCDGLYPNARAEEHHHSGDGCCESPARAFAVRNDGEPLLANDTRATVSLPGGVVDNEGLTNIYRYLRRSTVVVAKQYDEDEVFQHFYLRSEKTYTQVGKAVFLDVYEANTARDEYNGKMSSIAQLVLPDDENFIGDKVQTKDGNFTKRLSRAAHKVCAGRLEPSILSEVGNIASAHSQAVDFSIELTRDLNQSAGDFYHEDSCWWQSYFASRCALKSNGGLGLRTFDGEYEVTGRAWVMPLKNLNGEGADPLLRPTFETQVPDAFMVFNGYGQLAGYAAARIVSHMAGWTYRKIMFYCNPMFINGNTGYLIAPEEIANGYTDGSLSFDVEQHSNLFQSEAAAAAALTEKELTHVA